MLNYDKDKSSPVYLHPEGKMLCLYLNCLINSCLKLKVSTN